MIRKQNIQESLRFVQEQLEPRLLLAVSWGAIPKLIGQDLAVANYAQYDGTGQTIAIIDTGVDYNHPGLAGKYLGGYDFVSGDADPMDSDGHGTGVAGVIVANTFTYNGVRYQGIAPGARVVVLRVDNNREVPEDRYKSAFEWIIANRATYNITVVNASFGDGHYDTEAQRSTYAADMATLAAAGVFIVAASGNDGVTSPFGVEYPGADPSAFSAGSVDAGDAISDFTERGPILDILAPGESVPTTYLDEVTKAQVYQPATGTSFASPFVAGAAAILKQIDPTFTPHDIMSILRASGIDNFDGDDESAPVTERTYSRLNVHNAIRLALQRVSGQSSALVGVNGRENSLKFDRDGVLYFTWYDAVTTELKLATRSPAGDWSAIQTIDTAGDVGHYVSLAISSSGKPAVAYYDSTNADLKFSMWYGQGWGAETVDARGRTGMYPSLGFDVYDDPIITYYHRSAGDLRYAVDFGAGFAIGTIDSTNDVGRYSSFALNSADKWSVAYEDSTTGRFKFAQKATKSWSVVTVDSTTPAGGGYISLAFDNLSRPAFSYYDAWNANLKFARYNGSAWTTDTVASQFSQGLYTNLLMENDGSAEILYFNKTLDGVFRAAGDIGSWAVSQLETNGGRHLAVARFGSAPRMLARYDTASADLLLDSY